MDHNSRIYDNARRNSGITEDLSNEDDLLDQEYPPEGLMSEDDIPAVVGSFGSPKYGSPTSIRSRSSARIMDKKANTRIGSTGNLMEERARSPSLRRNTRKGSTGNLMEERARSPSLRRLSSANIKAEERARSPSLGRISANNRKNSVSTNNRVRPKTPSSRPASPSKAPAVDAVDAHVEYRDELIKLHRQSIKENNDFAKQESKILVNLTMKLGKQLLENPQGANLVDEAFDKYLDELDGILERKMSVMMQLKHYVSKLKKV